MKFKTFDLNAYKSKAGITLSFDKKDKALGVITSKLFYLDSKHPLKLKITNNQAEKYRIKQEIKQTEYKGKSPEGLYPLVEQVENGIAKFYNQEEIEHWGNWQRVFAYEDIYEVAFNRGVRHERKRRKGKRKELTAFDIIGADDVIELSNELGISEDKLTYAVLEIIAKRKNGGKA